MRQCWLHRCTMIGFAAALVLCQVSISSAQIDEARKANWENAKKLFQIIYDGTKGNNVREAFKSMEEFKTNMDIIQDKLERSGERLHDLDKSWLSQTARAKAIEGCKKVRLTAGSLQVAMQKLGEDPSSSLGDFKSAFDDFTANFNQFWTEYTARLKEIEERAKKFREDCKQCP
jgi:hypothetical protein